MKGQTVLAETSMALAESMALDGAGDSYLGITPSVAYEPQKPAFTLGPLPDYLRPSLYGTASLPAVGCYTLHDVRVGFDGILIRQNRLLHAIDLNHPQDHVGRAIAHNTPGWRTAKVRRVRGTAALIHGPGFDVYGHWLIDFLPRLWVLHRAGFDVSLLPILLPGRLPTFAMAILALLGMTQPRFIEYDQAAELLEVETLIVPSLLRRGDRFSPLLPAATSFWRSLIEVPFAPPAPFPHVDKIFVSRNEQWGSRQLKSRQAIELIARDAGYHIIMPELFSLLERIAIFSGATQIAGEYSSGLHNSIFAPPGARICALRGTSYHPGFAQSGLAEACFHQIGYVFGETAETALDQVFDIPPSLFTEALSSLESQKH
jgi:capsular polysaccharide biosynthesis protein